ncbi:MFS transporter [[Clostridium] fimetarium]|uniref:MFS transporter, NNP family, nitrate/nitrite transporter n=1 Tax=[Clostridium] fimetarium TaxID=99656 RepID=A0A1I0PF31_9FIRM|nr:MFS transporter [[Clostridium] fimetarium]SEW12893.1 MFS transporter, NNP family, nitrate/nitrite transporter [[Clostridium] fimetarium]
MEQKQKFNYGWIILAIFALGAFTYQLTQYQLTMVAAELIPKLGLTEAQFSSLVTAPLVPAIVLSIIVGILADKISIKIIVAIGMIISCIGGLGHIFATTNTTFYATMFLTGFGAVAINVTCGKIFSQWMKPAMISIAMGIFLAASTVGQFFAQSTTALLGSLNNVFWLSGIMCAIVLVLWVVLGREYKENGQAGIMEAPSFGETMKAVFASKNMWLCAFGLFFILGCQVAFNIWIPSALITKGMDPAGAGVLASIVSLGNLTGAIIMPIVATKVGKVKPFIIAFTIICALGYAFGWHLTGAFAYLCFFVFGFCAASLMTFFLSMPMKFKEVGPRFAGTGMGFAATIELLGSVLLPTYIILPLATIGETVDYTRYFYLVGAGWIIALMIGIFIPETGSKE